jgi:hypothetical protein
VFPARLVTIPVDGVNVPELKVEVCGLSATVKDGVKAPTAKVADWAGRPAAAPVDGVSVPTEVVAA